MINTERILGMILFLICSIQMYGQECFKNLIVNPSFEDFDVSTLPRSIMPEEGIVQGWYSTDFSFSELNTVDIMEANQPMVHSPVTTSVDGEVWMGMWGASNNREGFASYFIEPLEINEKYVLTYWTAARRDAKLRVFLYDQNNTITSDDFDQLERIEKTTVRSKKWKKHTVRFTAEKAYQQILFHNASNTILGVKYLVIDNIKLERETLYCCDGNIVPNSGFEFPSTYGGWGGIQSNFDSHLYDNYEALNESHDPSTPINDVHNNGSDNEKWIVLNSFYSGNNNVNCAITTELYTPLIPGNKYLLSFYGATRNSILKQKAHINIKLSTSSFCSTPDCIDSETDDWSENIPGTPIVEDFKLDGNARKWHKYEIEFIATEPSKYLLIQAQDGHHPALDDICITSIPFAPNSSGISDGTYLATVDYHNSNTNYSATYQLDVKIENGLVVKIFFPNGGYLDENDFESEGFNEDGYAEIDAGGGKHYKVYNDFNE